MNEQPLNKQPLIVLSLDALVPASLGCYGSSWSQTPTIDSLAARGYVWDRLIARHTDPLVNLRDWFGIDGHSQDEGNDWIDVWQRQGGIELLSDSHAVINLATKSRFDQLFLIDEVDADPAAPANEVESTQLAQLIASAVERIGESDPWSVLWLHSNFLTKRWDAPRWLVEQESDELEMEPVEYEEFAAEQHDEDDELDRALPWVFDQVLPPNLQLDESSNPDLITSWMRTYACQVRLIDDLLGVLLAATTEIDPTVVVCGTSGFSHGQNGWIGHNVGPLRSCQVRLPLIICPHSTHPSVQLRCQNVLGSTQLSEYLLQLGKSDSGTNDTLVSPEQWSHGDDEFDPVLMSESTRGDRAATSQQWFFVRQTDQQERLYLKPDDTEDVNDICRLRPDVVERLSVNTDTPSA